MIFTEVNTFISLVSSAFNGLSLNKWRRDFLTEIFMLYLVIPGRINFTQMSRYSNYSELHKHFHDFSRPAKIQ